MEQKRKKERRKLSINENMIQQVVNGSLKCKTFQDEFMIVSLLSFKISF